MNAQAIVPIAFEPSIRSHESLLIAVAGPTGSGKTRSALEIARGLCYGDDSAIGFIDTESGRARHYSPTAAERAAGAWPPDKFGFQHAELTAPFTPDRYRDAVAAANAAGFKAIIIDSASHEWNGEGGLQDWHDAIVEETVIAARNRAESNNWEFNAEKEAERASIGAWNKPKTAHKRFVTRMLQSRAHLIFCLRAEEKLLMRQVEKPKTNGKGTYKVTEVIAPADRPLKDRWVPICEKGFMYEMTCSVIVTPDRPGVPVIVKVEGQHRAAFPEDRQISYETGRFLADWARGDEAPSAPRATLPPPTTARPLADRVANAIAMLKAKATLGDLTDFWEHRSTRALRVEAEEKDPDGAYEQLLGAHQDQLTALTTPGENDGPSR